MGIILRGHNYPTQRIAGSMLFIPVCMAMSPLMTHFTESAKTQPKALTAALMHGMINATAGFSFALYRPVRSEPENELLFGFTGVAGVVGITAVNALLFAYRFFKKEQN